MPTKQTIKDFINKQRREFETFELDSNYGAWPTLVKIIMTTGIVILFIVFVTAFHFNGLKQEFNNLQAEETQLKEEVIIKIAQTSGLSLYQDKITEMENSFESLLSKLPTDIEMDGLLKDITEKGIDNGVEFKKLQMLKEVETPFYTEHPIEIIIEGTYHSLSKFISDVSTLGRIVTFHDFELFPKDSNNEDSLLQLKIIAKTYKYRNKREALTNE